MVCFFVIRTGYWLGFRLLVGFGYVLRMPGHQYFLLAGWSLFSQHRLPRRLPIFLIDVTVPIGWISDTNEYRHLRFTGFHQSLGDYWLVYTEYR